ncbi:hypothetical protein Pcinc_027840 [Petrolisthes cinctipes]|uniref:Uncharacterized protein n=1 Tax=Petrolisthes cinctipes TaxID=88211 RepID=A0AAE1F3L4_PETCI|nr:hypothetical protein Pcinc_027840 [Petrolisthes cinctipes]
MLAGLLSWVVVVLVSVVCGWVGWWLLLKPSPPPASVTRPYSCPSLLYPLKVVVFYCLVKLRKRQGESKNEAGYGMRSYTSVEEMECPQPLQPGPKAIDAVFFSGVGSKCKDGHWGVVTAMERRPNALTSVLIYLKVPGQGLLVRPGHPDTVAFRKTENEGCFSSDGLTITPDIPMATWNIHYKGKLKKYDKEKEDVKTKQNSKEIEAELKLEWVSNLPHFDYDTDLPVLTTARAFAAEPWSREFFMHLREHHQTHYEQMGVLQGTVTLDGITHSLYLPAFRDHSYGREREWRLMHRYVFHHIFLEDGTKGVVGVVCQPSTCSRLELGHWWPRYGCGTGVTSVNLHLLHHGEGGTPPTDYAFTFTAGGVEHLVEVEVEMSPQHYLGWEWEARMVETFVKYRVDGVAGAGVCEWQYRHKGGRPDHLNASDPHWTQDYRPQYLSAGSG